ncbi:MAG: hypothetical protein JEZ00_04295 [Anaerolineaceae bacterium]|nr:hypothetical protein [Anaerolineaceae bacterium]
MIQKIRMIILPALLLGLLVLTPIGTVLASPGAAEVIPPVEPTPDPNQGEQTFLGRANHFLERAYDVAGKLEEHIGKDLERVVSIEERITQAIERQEEQGEDTSDVQAALNAFLAVIPDLEANYAEGQAIYAEHAGFNADGEVTDIESAAETIESLKESFRETHRGWHEAVHELRDVLQAYREAHPLPEKQ